MQAKIAATSPSVAALAKFKANRALRGCAPLILLYLVVGILGSAVLAQNQEPQRLSTKDLVEMALNRNRQYLSLKEHVTETLGLLRQAGLRPFPTVETEIDSGNPLGSPGEEEYSAGLFLPIETSGKRGKRVTVAQKDVDLAQAEVKEAGRQLVFEVETRYAEVSGAQAKAKVVDQLMSASRDSYTLIEARVREGDAAPLEQQLLLADLNRTQAQQIDFQGQAESALLQLKETVGLAATEPLSTANLGLDAASVSAPSNLPPLSDLQKAALQTRPDLLIARILEEQGGAEVNLEKAEGRPDLTASARYIRRRSTFPQLGVNESGTPVPLIDRDNILAFGLSIPVFTGRRAEGAVEAATARQGAARLRREYLEASIPLEVEAAYGQWEAASRSVSLFSSGVIAQSEQNLTVMRESYRLGQLRALDVLNEQRRLIDTQLAYVDAEIELAKARAELERAIGGNLP